MAIKCELKLVLILSSIEQHARQDTISLQRMKPEKIVSLSSGQRAGKFLKRHAPDLVLCDSRLDDMSGVEFLKSMRRGLPGKFPTVVMVTAENRRKYVLETIAAGCSGYILRPYSANTFERHLCMAKRTDSFAEIEEIQIEEAKGLVQAGNFDDAIESFHEVVTDEQEDAQKYYEMGMDHLMREKYGKAIIAFKKAVMLNNLFAEAHKGLADAYMGKGDKKTAQEHLHKAAEIHAQFDRFEETKNIFISILQLEDTPPNPFNTLGVRLRKKGDLEGAIRAYSQAINLTPDDERLYYNLARAHLFMGRTHDGLKNLSVALAMNFEFAEAKELYLNTAGQPWNPDKATLTPMAAAKRDTILDD